jgi:hypothetical protein
MIREEIANFVELWNGHKIRMQKNCPHVVSGIPMDLYKTDQVRNWGISFDDDDDCGQLIHTMLEPLEATEIDEFMTSETSNWYNQQLQNLRFDSVLRTEEDFK